MKLTKSRFLIYLFNLIFLFLVLFQLWSLNNSYQSFTNSNNNLEIQNKKNEILKFKYQQSLNSKQMLKKLSLKEQSSEILFKAENLGLKLIDFNSNKSELNLNFNGDFYSILRFFYYLESNLLSVKISEFKIKSNDKRLFLFIKLRDERI